MTTLLDIVKEYTTNTKDDWNYITPRDYRCKYLRPKKPHLLLDIRKPSDFEKFHIRGSINIFWLDLFKEENLAKLPTDKPIFIMCYVGHTASQAMTLLKLLGYKAVAIKYGFGVSPVEDVPVAGWLGMGYPIHIPK